MKHTYQEVLAVEINHIRFSHHSAESKLGERNRLASRRKRAGFTKREIIY
jgi:hypothetical protein